MFKTVLSGISIFLFAVLAQAEPPRDLSQPLTSLAFGSCNHQSKPQSHWLTIQAFKPQVWIWGGDNIYGDFKNPEQRRAEYDRLKSHSYYQTFLTSVPVLATWDDHDFGDNNIGKTYQYKRESQRVFLDFIDEPLESPRWNQEGVYASYVWGPAGKRVKIVLLDVRYFRDRPGAEADILGEAQWSWLENVLGADPSEITFVVSGSQVIPKDHPGDKWMQYPAAYKRLLNLFEKTTGQIVVLSGDRHLAEISRIKLGDRNVYEFTSSGLTHTYPGKSPNKRRVGPLVVEKNFGLIKIDWDKSPAVMTFEIRGVDGGLLHRHGLGLKANLRSGRLLIK